MSMRAVMQSQLLPCFVQKTLLLLYLKLERVGLNGSHAFEDVGVAEGCTGFVVMVRRARAR